MPRDKEWVREGSPKFEVCTDRGRFVILDPRSKHLDGLRLIEAVGWRSTLADGGRS